MILLDETLKEKYNLMMKIDRYERALVELSNWNLKEFLSASTKQLTGEIRDEESKSKWIKTFEDIRLFDKRRKNDNGNKMYLSEIIGKEKPKFGNNNLILSPTGSGKTYFMKSLIKEEDVLLLVSTTSLKDKLVPVSETEREKLGSRMYSTKRKNVYGNGSYKILVMTYAEFGNKIMYKSKFANQYKQIFCDEIHSLFNYYNMSVNSANGSTLLIAIRYLFEDSSFGQERYYFTATDEHLEKFTSKSKGFFEDVKVFNYLNHPEIVKHMVLSSYKINGLEQVRPHLKARKDSFVYFDYKVFAFCKTISSQLYLKRVMESEGFTPLVLWSINNEDHIMDEEQLNQRDYVLRTGLIPDKYDTLIVNASMQEGWDLLDPQVKLVIMNTTNKTEFVQAVGRVRQDLDVLVYKVDSKEFDYYISFPIELLDTPLNRQAKDKLCSDLNIFNASGRMLRWPSIKKILERQGMIVKEKVILIDGKTVRTSIVSHPEVA